MPRAINSLQIPLPMQSVYMRYYCEKNKFLFTLPAVEICFKNSFYILRNLINNIPHNSHVCTSTINFLPYNDKIIFTTLLKDIKNKNITFHFPLENFIFEPDDFSVLNLFKH